MMGRKTMKDRTVARVRDILASHEPAPLKEGTDEVIQEVLEGAEDRVQQDWWADREIAD
jgi:trimethylamine:corrinoid methyltransferase-like protein